VAGVGVVDDVVVGGLVDETVDGSVVGTVVTLGGRVDLTVVWPPGVDVTSAIEVELPGITATTDPPSTGVEVEGEVVGSERFPPPAATCRDVEPPDRPVAKATVPAVTRRTRAAASDIAWCWRLRIRPASATRVARIVSARATGSCAAPECMARRSRSSMGSVMAPTSRA
jgi:hypothetical protein